jgi:type II secretory pathway pseudopilin PulG
LVSRKQSCEGLQSRRGGHRRGFTLLEALMAAGILLVVVVSVTSAIAAGQQNAYEAHQRIAATLAAEELISRLAAETYDNLPTWDGHTEAAGDMTDMDGNLLPASFAMIGRDVRVTTALKTVPGPDVRIRGRVVRVRAFNEHGRVLSELSRFTPEPQS